MLTDDEILNLVDKIEFKSDLDQKLYRDVVQSRINYESCNMTKLAQLGRENVASFYQRVKYTYYRQSIKLIKQR